MSLLSRVRRTIRRERLAARGARVLVALSGGSDSVALLLVMAELARTGELTLAGAAHLHHGLRGAAADADEAFCRALCDRRGVPFVSERADVRGLAEAERLSLEHAGSRARYEFLERMADRVSADVIAVGHTQDDQAETVLLRLLRGAGPRGLGAIRPRRGRIVRPLIDISRAELRAFLVAQGQPFREDASNDDVSIARNRIRHEVLPVLQRVSPSVVDVLARNAALAREDEEFLHAAAIERGAGIVLTEDSGVIRIDITGLRSAPAALRSRIALDAIGRTAQGTAAGFQHVAALLDLCDAPEGASLALPGLHVERIGASLRLSPAQGRESGRVNSFAFPLSIPGEVSTRDCTVAAEELGTSPRRLTDWVARGLEVGVAAAPLAHPLVVRSRRPGDRLRPLGAPGVRKLQDLLVDRKLPRSERDGLPLIVDARDRIVWVPGQTVAEEFRVTDPSQGVIVFRLRRLDPLGDKP